MTAETEVQKVTATVSSVEKTAQTVVADVAKAPAEVKTFWQKYGSTVTHVLTAVVAAYVGHVL
jgi:hypothetical protein